MKNHRLHDVVLGMLLMALIMGLAIPAFATTVKNLQANYADITLVVDGATIIPKDANGNIVEPFAVDGTTYLPVRAVGEALGKEVTWDGKINTVYVGEVPSWANSTWTGLRDLSEIEEISGVTYFAKDLPHIAAAIKETRSSVSMEYTGNLQLRPEDAWYTTSNYVTFNSCNDGYGKSGYAIECLHSFLPDDTSGYKILVRAILEDMLSDKDDIESVMALVEGASKLEQAYQSANSDSERNAIQKDLANNYYKTHTFNTITVDWSGRNPRGYSLEMYNK